MAYLWNPLRKQKIEVEKNENKKINKNKKIKTEIWNERGTLHVSHNPKIQNSFCFLLLEINKLFIITKLKTNRRDSDPFTPIREQSVLDKCLKLAKVKI